MLKRKRSFSFAATLVLIVLNWASAAAQSGGATLGGTVLDQNGAVVPSVTITVLNKTTGLERRVVTNEDGSFSFPLLPAGEYILTTQRDGFATIKVPDLVVEPRGERLVKLQLKIGSITGTIEIVTASSIIQKDSTTGIVFDQQAVSSLPANGGSLQSLITLAPGAVITDMSQGSGQFSSNGQRTNSNYYSIDGVSANVGISVSGLGQGANGSVPGLNVFGGTASLVALDAVQEVRVQTFSYAAEFGRTPGAQVQITTRSGNNRLSGSIFEDFRSKVLDARDFFDLPPYRPDLIPLDPSYPEFRYNNFGVSVGGPIVKDRTFFFVSYEGLSVLQPRTDVTAVPSLGARQSAPAAIKPFLDAFPVPNVSLNHDIQDPGGDTGLQLFLGRYSDPSTLNAAAIRIDHSLSKNITIFGRYDYAPSSVSQRGIAISPEAPLSQVHSITQNAQTLTGGMVWLIGPQISNEVTANYSRFAITSRYLLDNFGGAQPFGDGLVFPPQFSQDNAFFELTTDTDFSSLAKGTDTAGVQRQINIVDGLSINSNSHQLKFGVDYRRLLPHSLFFNYAQRVSFSGLVVNESGPFFNPDLTLLSGKASDAEIQSNSARSLGVTNLSLYAQDTWKPSRRVAFTYGMRWELNPAPQIQYESNILTLATVNGSPTLVVSKPSSPLYRTRYTNFAPRLGLSVQLIQSSGRELVLRAGGGAFYDLGYAGGDLTSSVSSNGERAFIEPTFPLDPSLAAPIIVFTGTNIFDNFVPFLQILDPNLKTPVTYEWNVMLEQSLGKNQVLTVSYVGASASHLLQQQTSSITASQGPVELRTITSAASSNYNSLQIQFQRRLIHGLGILASYTLAHSIDDASSDAVNLGLARGPSDFDIRHSFTSALSYALPKSFPGFFANRIIRDWSIDLISRARSALPVDVVQDQEIQLQLPSFEPVRPDLVPGVPLYLTDPNAPGGRRINAAAFSLLPQGVNREGTLGRNALRGFPAWQIDLGAHRSLNINDRIRLQISAEIYNVLNHPNFANPNGNLSAETPEINAFSFGTTTQTLGTSLTSGGLIGGLNSLSQIGGPRSVQFGVRMQF